jgi:uncharacterized membrane protein YgcG
MASRSAMRASDADREHVAERLRRAAIEGRLRTEELEQRLEAALSSRTYGELDAVIRDLPGRRLAAPPRSQARPVRNAALVAIIAPAVAVATAIAVLFVLTGVFAGWLLWILVGSFFIGRRRHAIGRGRARYGRTYHGCGGWPAGRSRRYWA